MINIKPGYFLSITTKESEKLFKIIDIQGEDIRLEDTVLGVFITEKACEVSSRLSRGEAEIISDKDSLKWSSKIGHGFVAEPVPSL